MKTMLTPLLGLLTCAFCLPAFAQGTAFTYQGRLNSGGDPAAGSYDLTFTLFSTSSGAGQVGSTVTNLATAVSNGLFTVTLDFGNQFPGAARWLEIGVRTNGSGAFTTLAPRQPLTASPYAVTAGNVTGNISATQLPASVATNGGNISGTFSGNGANVTDVNAAALDGISSAGFWKTTGNAGTSPAANFIGAADNARLLIRGGFVGINRSAPISPQEYFGFDAPAAPGDFGGMYINTTTPNGLPFYGYGLNGGVYAYHYVDGVDAYKWKLAFGGYAVPALTAVPGNPTSSIGIGTANPEAILHVYSANNPTVMRIQSTGTPGFGRVEFVSNPQGDVNEWRPGYIQSLDAGGFTGGLGFYLNGTGAGNKFGSNEVMRLINGAVGINTNNPQSALHVNGEVRWGSGNTLSVNQGGSIELGDSLKAGTTPFIDFHLGGNSFQDYNVRIINSFNEALEIYRLSSSTAMARFTAAGLTVNGTVVSASDRNAKENFKSVDARQVLAKVVALPVSRWNYKEDKSSEHIGPMAQDFYAAFNVGPDNKHIATIDEGGVALAAIQGLNDKLEELRSELSHKDAENAELKQRLEALERCIRNQKQNSKAQP